MSVSTVTLDARVKETAESDLFDLYIRVVETSGQMLPPRDAKRPSTTWTPPLARSPLLLADAGRAADIRPTWRPGDTLGLLRSIPI